MINFYCLNSYINISQQIYITSHHLHKFTVRRQYNSYALPTFFCFSFAQFLVFHTFLRNYIFSFKLSFIYLTYISLCIHYIQFFFYSLEYNTFIKLIGEKYLKWHAIIYKHVFFLLFSLLLFSATTKTASLLTTNILQRQQNQQINKRKLNKKWKNCNCCKNKTTTFAKPQFSCSY